MAEKKEQIKKWVESREDEKKDKGLMLNNVVQPFYQYIMALHLCAANTSKSSRNTCILCADDLTQLINFRHLYSPS